MLFSTSLVIFYIYITLYSRAVNRGSMCRVVFSWPEIWLIL